MVRDLATVGFGKGPSRARDAKQIMPHMQDIHHSIKPEEVNFNWSSGLTVWDWLHGTLGLDVPQDAITSGVPGYLDPQGVTLPKSSCCRCEMAASPKRQARASRAREGVAKLFVGNNCCNRSSGGRT
jgi:hypothetical protein